MLAFAFCMCHERPKDRLASKTAALRWVYGMRLLTATYTKQRGAVISLVMNLNSGAVGRHPG